MFELLLRNVEYVEARRRQKMNRSEKALPFREQLQKYQEPSRSTSTTLRAQCRSNPATLTSTASSDGPTVIRECHRGPSGKGLFLGRTGGVRKNVTELARSSPKADRACMTKGAVCLHVGVFHADGRIRVVDLSTGRTTAPTGRRSAKETWRSEERAYSFAVSSARNAPRLETIMLSPSELPKFSPLPLAAVDRCCLQNLGVEPPPFYLPLGAAGRRTTRPVGSVRPNF
jgi:hypothetical protein